MKKKHNALIAEKERLSNIEEDCLKPLELEIDKRIFDTYISILDKTNRICYKEDALCDGKRDFSYDFCSYIVRKQYNGKTYYKSFDDFYNHFFCIRI